MASVFNRLCTKIDGLLARHAEPGELEKRLGALDVALDGFLEANEAYMALLEEMEEIEEAGQYAARITQKHGELTNRVREALASPPQKSQADATGSRVSGSLASRSSRASVASKDAEISAELKELELRQLRARQKQEELKEAERKRREAERREQEEQMEAERRKQEQQREVRAAEDELERLHLKARLWKAAESALTLERRNDFEDEDAEEAEPPHDSPASVLQVTEEQAGTDLPSGQPQPVSQGYVGTAGSAGSRGRPNTATIAPEGIHILPSIATAAPRKSLMQTQGGPNPDCWIEGLGSDSSTQSRALGPSAFVKSIPRLSLPTFNGNPREWPRWIGLFKALVHD